MRESIGGTQLFIIVIALVLVFSGIMALSINHSNAFAIKDKIVSVIEKNGSFDIESSCDGGCSGPIQEIVDLLQENAYRQKGDCSDVCAEGVSNCKVKAYDRDGTTANEKNASFCIVKLDSSNTGSSNPANIEKYYYKVVVFYRLDIPILKSVFSFKAIGETKGLYA